ncbi:tyrosine-protein phosphatase [Echinimonas agarilytica]|uniref:Tyrosine-protein phosphatase n=1 Tax=Echinimonas agarilytica TaxID=1215918 RepID=A0AA42B8J3_9GAMM|nr:tyrosine-protein phosphatase [Echinimonas agarilytica]MCM2680276.1 tyrosine-protein phosphatase [Echinimonas agarilytica]
MSTHPFDPLALPEFGTLLLTPCPGTKDVDLPSSIEQLKQAGAVAVVTMMPEQEMEHFGVTQLPEICHQQGLRWFNFPIEDDCAPEAAFEEQWAEKKDDVLEILSHDGTVVLHCKGGTGRTGLMAAIIQKTLGVPLQKATEAVKSIRPKSLTIPAHTQYLQSL